MQKVKAKGNRSQKLLVDDLLSVFNWLKNDGYRVVGPVEKDGAIVLDDISSFDQIACGYYDNQAAGSYSLEHRDDGSFFQYTVGPQSFKKFLNPPRRQLWSADKSKDGFAIKKPDYPKQKLAFWGIRSCDLAGILTLDKTFLEGKFTNSWYEKARKDLFVLTVGCSQFSQNCFCTSMNTGPEASTGFDLKLIEVKDEKDHFFIGSAGSKSGQKLLSDIHCVESTEDEALQAESNLERVKKEMPVRLDRDAVAESLKKNIEHPHWNKVAEKCLSCANCTMVCPTCFCSSTEDVTDLTGDHTERWLHWDSCFNGDFTYIHGGNIRPSTYSRYRQWLTHKLSSWYDQFGTSGCVGCGRCITWCPVGIDLTEEVKQLQNGNS